ncbi:MAG: hypothetical protein LQ342_003144 [Letrouitia transgressa]|nr:MAG: hypothetical protein LQ342_003144 [Letrouitia transgressa]
MSLLSAPSLQHFLVVVVLATSSTLAASTCYAPNGTAIIDEFPYTPCNTNDEFSMCCRITTTDTCRPDGLCDSGWDGKVWRDYCTDPTWEDPSCVKLCVDGANDCCSNGGGVFVVRGHTTDVNPSSLPTPSARRPRTRTRIHTTSSTTSHSKSRTPTRSPSAAAADTANTRSGPSPTTSVLTTLPSPLPPEENNNGSDTNHTGAIAGGVVGGFAAGAFLVTAVLFYLRRQKRNKDTAKATPHNPPLFAQERVVGPEGYYEVGKRRLGEMDGQSLGRREELDAGPPTAEMETGQKREGREGRWELPT